MKDKSPIKLRQKNLKNGNISLYLETYQYGRKMFEFLHLYLVPEVTKIDKQRNQTTLMQAEAHRAKRILELQNGKYGVVHGMHKTKRTFVEFVQEMGATKNEGRKKLFKDLARYVTNYGDLPLQSVSANYLRSFLITTFASMASNTKRTFYALVGQVMREATKQGYFSTNPYAETGLKLPKYESRANEFLTLAEIQKIMTFEQPTNRTKRGQNAFLFSCFTGLRRGDIKSLTWGNIKTREDGTKYIQIRQQKTHEEVIIPLSENALRFIPKPPQPIKVQPNDKVFIRLTIGGINGAMKRLSEFMGKRVHFHMGRHTCATLLLSHGADLYTISKLLGHTSITTTQIYAEVTDQRKANAVNLIPTL